MAYALANITKYAKRLDGVHDASVIALTPLAKASAKAVAACHVAEAAERAAQFAHNSITVLLDIAEGDAPYVLLLNKTNLRGALDLVTVRASAAAADVDFEAVFETVAVTVKVRYHKTHYSRGDPDGDDQATYTIPGFGSDDDEDDEDPAVIVEEESMSDALFIALSERTFVWGTDVDEITEEARLRGDHRSLETDGDHKSSVTRGVLLMSGVMVSLRGEPPLLGDICDGEGGLSCACCGGDFHDGDGTSAKRAREDLEVPEDLEDLDCDVPSPKRPNC
jgi:hypothetical protein